METIETWVQTWLNTKHGIFNVINMTKSDSNNISESKSATLKNFTIFMGLL